jgi:serine/threonine protein kinase
VKETVEGQQPEIFLSDFSSAAPMLAQYSGEPFSKDVEYAAPEVVFGQPYNHRIDMWSAGVCVYEALTGQKPFPEWGENGAEHCKAIDSISPFPQLSLSESALDFIKSLLDPRPAYRATANTACEHAWFSGLDLSGKASEKMDLRVSFGKRT